MAKEFKMPSAPSRPSSKSVSTNLAVIAEDATAASCSSSSPSTTSTTTSSTTTTTATSSCLSTTSDSSLWSKYSYDGHGNEYPKRRADGKWAIAYDNDNWEEVIVDDIEGMDPSQFQTTSREPVGTPVQLTAVIENPDAWEPKCMDVIPYDDAANHASGSGLSRPPSPAGPSQNLEWPSVNNWNSYNDVPTNPMSEVIPGVVGLNNLGNTCFLNSGLQCLFNTPSFVDSILLNDGHSPIHPRTGELNNSLGSCFISLFNKVWSKSRTESVIKPSEFKDTLGQYHLQFQDYRQHDCQEFLALLLGTLHDQFNRATQTTSTTSSRAAINSVCGSNLKEVVEVNVNETSESCPVESTCATDSPKSCEDTSSVSSSSSSTGSEMDQTSAILRHQPLPASVQPFLVPSEPVSVDNTSNHHIHHRFMDGSSEAMSVDQSNIIPYDKLSGNVSSSTSTCPSSSTSTKVSSRSRATSQSENVRSRNDSVCGQEKNEIYDRRRIESCDSLVDSTEFVGKSSEVDDEPSSSTVDGNQEEKKNFLGRITVEYLEKDMKIPNSNFLIDTVNTNNKIMFDSSKFPKFRDNLRNNQSVVDNLRNPFVGNEDGDIVMSSEDSQFKNNSLKRVKNDNVVSGTIMDITSSTTAVTLSPSSQCSSSSGSTATSTKIKDHCYNGNKKKKVDEASAVVNSIDDPMEDVNDHQNNLGRGDMNHHDDDGDLAWNEYLSKNQSMIVDTFQGQFKSTVRCLTCNHVSVTFEPFMYLPVPLPHALEKQVVVTFIKCSETSYTNQPSPPIQYLINIHKFDRLSRVVTELKKILDEERSQCPNLLFDRHDSDQELKLILAEVKSNHVVRILDDYLSVKFIEDDSLCVFQVLTSKSAPSEVRQEAFMGPLMPNLGSNMDAVVPDGHDVSTSDNANLIIDDLEHLRPNFDRTSPTLSPSKMGLSPSHDAAMYDDPGGIISSTSHQQLDSSYPAVVESWKTDFGADSTGEDHVNDEDDHNNKEPLRSCIVCLEDKPRINLLQHHGCSCIICISCLNQHSSLNAIESSDQFMCPTCQIKLTKTAYATLDQPPPQVGPFTTIIPIVFRVEKSSDSKKTVTFGDNINLPSSSSTSSAPVNGRKSYDLVCHPVLIDCPKSITSSDLYKLIDPFVPYPIPYSIHYVRHDGQSCCRCGDNWTTPDCSGCEIHRSTSSTLIMPMDVLAVEFDPLFISEYGASMEAPAIVKHESLANKRSQEPLTLIDCIKAFHESDILDSDNRPYCPSCSSNQRANKTLFIWRYPKTLMVYLKRFLFHEMQPNKVDDTVTFPIDTLDMSQFMRKKRVVPLNNASATKSNDQTSDKSGLYSLQSFVCHSGGVSAGHYTAFAKHVVTNKWYYFNDSSVTAQDPACSDDRAYILFYDKIDADHQDKNTRRLSLIDQTMMNEGGDGPGNGEVLKLMDPPKKCAKDEESKENSTRN